MTTPAWLLDLLPDGGTAQPETFVNAALNRFDAVSPGFYITDRSLTAPIGGEVDGDVFLVRATATGAWADRDGYLAFRSNGWLFVEPRAGTRVWVLDERIFIIYDGSTWNEIATGSGGGGISASDVDNDSGVSGATVADALDTLDAALAGIPNATRVMSISVANPGATEDIFIAALPYAITVTALRCVLVGSATPSVTWNVSHGTSRASLSNDVQASDKTTTSTTSFDSVTSFGGGDPTIPSGSMIGFNTSAQSGTVTELCLVIEFTED